MLKSTCKCILALLIIAAIVGNAGIAEASIQWYPQPNFPSIDEFVDWLETVDAANFQSGRFESGIVAWRNRDEIFIPYFNNPGINIAQVAVIPHAGGMMVHFIHSTPVGLSQITVRATIANPQFIHVYEARGIGAYYTASRRGEFDVVYVSEKTITARDMQTDELVNRTISYAYVETTASSAFTMFIMDGFELGITYRNPMVTKFFNDLVWDTTPITYRPPITRAIRFTIGSNDLTIAGVPHTIDVAPFIDPVYERTMIPLRAVSEALGAHAQWIPEIQLAIISTIDGQLHNVMIGEPLPDRMGLPVLYQGRVFVPLRYVADILGADTRWDEANAAVYVYR